MHSFIQEFKNFILSIPFEHWVQLGKGILELMRIFLSWPIIVLVMVFIFRKEISNLLNQMLELEIFGQKAKFRQESKELRRNVEKAQEEIPSPMEEKTNENADKEKEEFDEILNAASTSPELGIVRLWATLESEIKILVASLGHLRPHSRLAPTQMFGLLQQKGLVPIHMKESLRILAELRNEVVHGTKAPDKRALLQVLDTGLSLLKTIKAIPHGIHKVAFTNVDLYSDEPCTQKREGVKGLILRTESPTGVFEAERIFPTLKPDYYQPGKLVSWEWDLSNTWRRTWYLDPTTHEKKKAWDSAGEFSGRHLNDI